MSTDQNIRPPTYHSAQGTEEAAQRIAAALDTPVEDVRLALGIGAPRAAKAAAAPAKAKAIGKAKRKAPKAKRKAARGR